MNNKNEETKLENSTNNINVKEFQKDPEYATVKQLNTEASVRADTDGAIYNYFETLTAEQTTKIGNNEERITDLESGIWDKIRELEAENKELNSKLVDANKSITEKDNEIKKLQDEIVNSGSDNDINLKFVTPPQFTLTEIMTVKDFINSNLKDLIISKMEIRYPETVFGQDYTILIDGLDYLDVMQGKMVPVAVKALESGKLTGEDIFEIIVIYNYNDLQQTRFVEEFLLPAVPVSLRNVSEDLSPNYNVPDEIVKTRPLKLLLNNKDFKHLTFKIFAELNAGSYWSDFHRDWQFIKNTYLGTGSSTIGVPKIINGITDLYDTTSYYHNIFRIIEKRLNDSGVPCTITKKWARSSHASKLLHTLGNLTFDVFNSNLNDNEIITTQSRYYYLMVNFEISINNNVKKFYRGVTLKLTDTLELY